MRVLVVEDDEIIGPDLVEALAGQGYETRLAPTGQAALDEVVSAAPDLIMLDLGLPDVDGTVLCRQLRAESCQAVIVVLTARTKELEVVVALDAGADDYLTKPFRLAELLARVRAHLRRQAGSPDDRTVTVGRVSVGLAARRVEIAGQVVPLRPKEFDLLAALVTRAGEVVSRDRLMDEVWDVNWFGSTRTLDVHISALRGRLRAHGEDPWRITSVRGRGYRYETEA